MSLYGYAASKIQREEKIANLSLEDTCSLMCSDDYKVRFAAEYFQLFIRYYKLDNLITKFYNDELDFKLSNPIGVLVKQLDSMMDYLQYLEIRAEIENICLDPDFYLSKSKIKM